MLVMVRYPGFFFMSSEILYEGIFRSTSFYLSVIRVEGAEKIKWFSYNALIVYEFIMNPLVRPVQVHLFK